MSNHKRKLGQLNNVALINKDNPTKLHANILDDAQAVGRHVFVEQKAAKETASGLFIPDAVKQSMAWVVVSVGAKVYDACGFDLQSGDRILFKGADEMNLGGRKFGFIDAGQILCRLNPEKAAEFFDEKKEALLTEF